MNTENPSIKYALDQAEKIKTQEKIKKSKALKKKISSLWGNNLEGFQFDGDKAYLKGTNYYVCLMPWFSNSLYICSNDEIDFCRPFCNLKEFQYYLSYMEKMKIETKKATLKHFELKECLEKILDKIRF